MNRASDLESHQAFFGMGLSSYFAYAVCDYGLKELTAAVNRGICVQVQDSDKKIAIRSLLSGTGRSA